MVQHLVPTQHQSKIDGCFPTNAQLISFRQWDIQHNFTRSLYNTITVEIQIQNWFIIELCRFLVCHKSWASNWELPFSIRSSWFQLTYINIASRTQRDFKSCARRNNWSKTKTVIRIMNAGIYNESQQHLEELLLNSKLNHRPKKINIIFVLRNI